MDSIRNFIYESIVVAIIASYVTNHVHKIGDRLLLLYESLKHLRGAILTIYRGLFVVLSVCAL